jgi:polysaccharide biosynthesis/export protein
MEVPTMTSSARHLLRARACLAGAIALLAVAVPSAPAGGQPAPAQRSSLQVAGGYVLGPEDVLEVTVWRYADLARVVAVRPDGKIGLPLVGEVQVAHLTVEHLTEVLIRAYSAYIINPQVTIIIKEFRKIHVSVLSQVAKPGTYALPPGSPLLDLVSAAGGVTELAALKEAKLLRPGKEPIPVDLDRLLAGDVALNVPLQGGETLLIPEDLVNIVNVAGDVAKPGRYRLKGDMRVLDVLLLAGGLTEKASVTGARVVRLPNEAVPFSLDGVLFRQDMSQNIALRPGDTIIVPEETNNKIYVLGDVTTPGVYPLKGNVTLLQAVAMAGGPVQRGFATAKTVQVVRRNGVTSPLVASQAKVEPLPNASTLITVDLQALIQRGDATRDVPVAPGDVVVIPQSGLSGFQMILSILAGITAPFR